MALEEYKYESTEQEAPGTLLGNLKGAMGKMTGNNNGGNTASDERLKNIFGDNEDIINIFAKIDAIKFKYNDEAHNIPDGDKHGIDNDLHLGIKAQDLEKNPLTESAVSEDEHGHKIVDTKELTMANSAVLSEICKRIEAIEKVLGIKAV